MCICRIVFLTGASNGGGGGEQGSLCNKSGGWSVIESTCPWAMTGNTSPLDQQVVVGQCFSGQKALVEPGASYGREMGAADPGTKNCRKNCRGENFGADLKNETTPKK